MRSTPRHGAVKWPGIMHKVLISKFGHKSEKAQELVEFALVLPLLLLIVFGVLDLGRAFHAAIAITNASREGARFGTIRPDATANEIRQATRNEAANSGIDLSASPIAVSCPDTAPPAGTCDNGEPIEVTVTFNFNLLIGQIISIPSIQLVYSAEMRVP